MNPSKKSEIKPTIKPEINPTIGTGVKSEIKPAIESSVKSEIMPEDNKPVISDEKILTSLKKPDAYGIVKVPENATLARMMRLIYGSFRYSYLNKLIKYNSNLNDPNNVKTGMNINFPVIESSDYPDDKKFFIVLFETDNFKKSFITAHNYQTSEFDVRILPVWRTDKGFLFPVVINKSFVSLNAANRYKKSQPEIIFAECKPVSQMKNNGKKQKG